MYFTDRGIEELVERRGRETVTVSWLAERLRDFVDLNPEFETPTERFATWLARLDEDDLDDNLDDNELDADRDEDDSDNGDRDGYDEDDRNGKLVDDGDDD